MDKVSEEKIEKLAGELKKLAISRGSFRALGIASRALGGAATGGIAGALSSDEGERGKGFVRGALAGGLVGGALGAETLRGSRLGMAHRTYNRALVGKLPQTSALQAKQIKQLAPGAIARGVVGVAAPIATGVMAGSKKKEQYHG